MAGVLVLALLVFWFIVRPALGGSGIGGALGGGPEPRHPSGPQSAWLDDRYANGFQSWEADGIALGVSADRSSILMNTVSAPGTWGADLLTGAEKWRDAELQCGYDSVYDGIAYCTKDTDTGSDLMSVDISTGATTTFYQAPFVVGDLEPIGVVDGNVIIAVMEGEGTRVLSFPGDSEITWQEVVPGGGFYRCHLVSGHVACDSSGGYIVYDAATGTPTVPLTELNTSDVDQVYWASDGYWVSSITDISLDPEPLPFYDLNGTEVGTAESPGTPSFPTDRHDVFYTLEDAQADDTVLAVDAQGNVVASVLGTGSQLHPSGAELAGFVNASSADGAVVLFDDGTTWWLYDNEGNQIADLGIQSASYNAQILHGVVVAADPLTDTVTVYAPTS